MSAKEAVRKVLWKCGYDISRFSPITHPLARRKRLMEAYGINIVLDVGANTGQFARQLRYEMGYPHRIVSFEPLSSAYTELKRAAQGDALWKTCEYALGDSEARTVINVAGNSYSSSLVGMLPTHEGAAPESRYIGQEEIVVKTLDSVFDEFCSKDDKVYLKIDTQGFEHKVLKGAERSLSHIDTVQIEMSLVPLYEDQLLFEGMFRLMADKGYTMVALETGFSDRVSGQLLQVDGIFHRA